MKKRVVTIGLSMAISLSAAFASFAGQWQNDDTGWWYQDDNGGYPVNQWVWIDGNNDGVEECYYFGGNGYMLANTTTSDGYTVDANGAWTVNGTVQTQTAETTENTQPQETAQSQTPAPTHTHNFAGGNNVTDLTGHYEQKVTGQEQVVVGYEQILIYQCGECGKILRSYEEWDDHSWNESHGGGVAGYVDDYSKPIYETRDIVENVWVEDHPAWDDTITMCTICGATK